MFLLRRERCEVTIFITLLGMVSFLNFGASSYFIVLTYVRIQYGSPNFIVMFLVIGPRLIKPLLRIELSILKPIDYHSIASYFICIANPIYKSGSPCCRYLKLTQHSENRFLILKKTFDCAYL